MTNNTGNICTECDVGQLIPNIYSDDFQHGNKVLHVENLECFECDHCGADPIYADQIRRNQLKIADAKRSADSLWTSAHIISFRERYGLTQADASSLFGGGANAFSKYERGDVIQSIAMDNQLKLAATVPGALEFLALRAGVSLSTVLPVKSGYSAGAKVKITPADFVGLPVSGKSNIAYFSGYPKRKCA
jgi:HTH-type transcriptional regulator / antitoxin MqsA